MQVFWTSAASQVIVTGSFDNWSQSIVATQQPDGSFVAEIPAEKGTEILFKFLVDGEWVTGDYPTESDENGNLNNRLVVGEGLLSLNIFIFRRCHKRDQ